MGHHQSRAFGPIDVDVVLRRLEGYGPLGDADRSFIRELGATSDWLPSGAELMREGLAKPNIRYLTSGWACYQRELRGGRRQIFAFILPGDVIGVAGNPWLPALADVIALTPVRTMEAGFVAGIDPTGRPALTAALRAAVTFEGALFREHLVRLGRLTVTSRIAHLFLELHARLKLVGLATDNSFALPLTQQTMADALGVSAIHLNRALQDVRSRGLIELKGGQVHLLRPRALVEMSGFEGHGLQAH